MADDIRKTIPQLNAGGVVSGSLFESAQPAQTSTGYASVKVTSDDIAAYTNSTKSYSALNTSAKQIIPAINEAASMGGVVQLTQAEYTALSTAEKMNGSIYKLTDKAIFYCLDEEYHAVKELTTAQYEALTTAEKNNGTIYIQTDAETTGEDIPVNTLTPDTSINSAINACFGRTASDIPYSSGVSVADAIDGVIAKTDVDKSFNAVASGFSDTGSRILVFVPFPFLMADTNYNVDCNYVNIVGQGVYTTGITVDSKYESGCMLIVTTTATAGRAYGGRVYLRVHTS